MQRSLKNHVACVSLTHEKASVLPRRGVTADALKALSPSRTGCLGVLDGALVVPLILLVVLPRNIDRKSYNKTAEEAVSAAWRARAPQGGTCDYFGFRFPERIFRRQSATPKHARAPGLPTFSVWGRPAQSLHCRKSAAFSNGVNLDCGNREWYKRCR